MPTTDQLGPAVRLLVLVTAGAAVYVAATLAFARSIVMPMWIGLERSGRDPMTSLVAIGRRVTARGSGFAASS